MEFERASVRFRRFASVAVVAGSLAALSLPPARAGQDESDLLRMDSSKFTRSTVVDNKWMPLKVGRQLVLNGSTVDEGRRIPHRFVFTVTDLVKTINGVPAVVVLEKDFSRGKLEEIELTFFAQDDEGNVWHLGEVLERYDEEEYVGTQAWMVGHLKGAHAGIVMKANPRENQPSYSQGFAPDPYHWTDRARVVKVDDKTTVPAGTYDPVLVVEEFDKSAPTAAQIKYYAQGVGTIKVGYTGDDPLQEILELTRVVDLTPEEMAKARAEAAGIEERAFVYGTTKPATQRTQ